MKTYGSNEMSSTNIEITSVKGNTTVETILAAAEWIHDMQPAFGVQINGVQIDWEDGDDVEAIEAVIASKAYTLEIEHEGEFGPIFADDLTEAEAKLALALLERKR